jgi:hypothetical protein
MKTTVKSLIKNHIISVCKAKTAIMREKQEHKPKKQITKKAAEEAFAALRKQFSQEAVDVFMHAMSLLLGAPEISPRIFPLEQFGVVVLGKNNGGVHAYDLNVPLIITNHQTPRLFHSDGSIANWPFGMVDDPRPATDEEVVTCMDRLTDAQWRCIMVNSLFETLVKEAMNYEFDITANDDVKYADSDTGQIESNGRIITIGKEQ